MPPQLSSSSDRKCTIGFAVDADGAVVPKSVRLSAAVCSRRAVSYPPASSSASGAYDATSRAAQHAAKMMRRGSAWRVRIEKKRSARRDARTPFIRWACHVVHVFLPAETVRPFASSSQQRNSWKCSRTERPRNDCGLKSHGERNSESETSHTGQK